MAFASPVENLLHDLVYYILYRRTFFLLLFGLYNASGSGLRSAMTEYGLLP